MATTQAGKDHVSVDAHTVARLGDLGWQIPTKLGGFAFGALGNLIGDAMGRETETKPGFNPNVNLHKPFAEPMGRFDFRESPKRNETIDQQVVPQQTVEKPNFGDRLAQVGEKISDASGTDSVLQRGPVYSLLRGVLDSKWVDERDKLARQQKQMQSVLGGRGSLGNLHSKYLELQNDPTFTTHERIVGLNGLAASATYMGMQAEALGTGKAASYGQFADVVMKTKEDIQKSRDARVAHMEKLGAAWGEFPDGEMPEKGFYYSPGTQPGYSLFIYPYSVVSDFVDDQTRIRAESGKSVSVPYSSFPKDRLKRDPEAEETPGPQARREQPGMIRPVARSWRDIQSQQPRLLQVSNDQDAAAGESRVYIQSAQYLQDALDNSNSQHLVAERVRQEEEMLDQMIAGHNQLGTMEGGKGVLQAQSDLKKLKGIRNALRKSAVNAVGRGMVIDPEKSQTEPGLHWTYPKYHMGNLGEGEPEQGEYGRWQNTAQIVTYDEYGQEQVYKVSVGEPKYKSIFMHPKKQISDRYDELSDRKQMIKHFYNTMDGFQRSYGHWRRSGWDDTIAYARQRALFKPVTRWIEDAMFTPSAFNISMISDTLEKMTGYDMRQATADELNNALAKEGKTLDPKSDMYHEYTQPVTAAERHLLHSYMHMFLKLRTMVDEQRFSNEDAMRAMASLGDPMNVPSDLIMGRIQYAIRDATEVQWTMMETLQSHGLGNDNESPFLQEAFYVPWDPRPMWDVGIRDRNGVLDMGDPPLGMEEDDRQEFYDTPFDPNYTADRSNKISYTDKRDGRQWVRMYGSFWQPAHEAALVAKGGEDNIGQIAEIIERRRNRARRDEFIKPYANYIQETESSPRYRKLLGSLQREQKRRVRANQVLSDI